MAQTSNFWKLHGEKGRVFKSLILDRQTSKKNLGFPISQVFNDDLAALYFKYKEALTLFQQGKITQEEYLKIKSNYKDNVKFYHEE